MRVFKVKVQSPAYEGERFKRKWTRFDQPARVGVGRVEVWRGDVNAAAAPSARVPELERSEVRIPSAPVVGAVLGSRRPQSVDNLVR
jgi:hypothetical protein